MPPFETTNTIYYEPITSTTTSTSATSPTIYTTIGPSSISFIQEDTEGKTKEYCNKVDQHVDKLEEDIEFLNNQRISHDQLIEILTNENIKKESKIKDLTNEIRDMQRQINYLLVCVDALEKKINK